MNIVEGNQYCFKVRARNSCSNGIWSQEECVSVCSDEDEEEPEPETQTILDG
jgi:hypothetical protein